ncbi:MAG: X-Pro aminopeptidase [Candidatus Nephrothrix sp. EaCA]|nr:MAG: X-Pro aminopeptidase [Candidatus Nephrothrix sp. EaCA]
MRHSKIKSGLFIAQRKRLVKELKKNSLAVVNSNDVMPLNADGTARFRQNSDLYYLTGVQQEETILVLCPDFPEKRYREILFLRETNDAIARWEGHKLTKDEAREQTGIETVLWLSEFPKLFHQLMAEGGEHVYLNTNEHYRAEVVVQSRDARFISWCKGKYPLHHYHRLAPLMARLRSVKHKEEIALLQKACDITHAGFRRVLKTATPGIKEYEIEAEYLHEFVRSGSRGFAYEPIIASGGDSCVLHYIENSKACKSGEVLLLDVGAEYAGYNADLTRTIPVSGKFSDRQKEVYNSVLKAMRTAIKMLEPGLKYHDYQWEIQKLVASELVDLKLLNKSDLKNNSRTNPACWKYFMHGTSHPLGLDVHDLGSLHEPMKEGQVWTVEPGIYIPEEKLGVRLENNVVLTSKGTLDLMRDVPTEAEEIEELMNEASKSF